jgi:hypothetical protein
LEKRARFGSAVLDVGDGQDAGRDRLLSPAPQRGPEHHPALGPAESLRGAAAMPSERLLAPGARKFVTHCSLGSKSLGEWRVNAG